jgi:hypothetical protein
MPVFKSVFKKTLMDPFRNKKASSKAGFSIEMKDVTYGCQHLMAVVHCKY